MIVLLDRSLENSNSILSRYIILHTFRCLLKMQKEPGASMLIVLPQQQKCTAAIKELDEINVCWNFHKLGLKGTPARKSQSYSRVKGVSKLSEIM